ncbi:hypothetical protein CEB3_c32970 [Peptococcaceae bacterium CEB3]|nr:hypothetical protein CEB3_c32970 [Peptococcaceae bacterium CEB3]
MTRQVMYNKTNNVNPSLNRYEKNNKRGIISMIVPLLCRFTIFNPSILRCPSFRVGYASKTPRNHEVFGEFLYIVFVGCVRLLHAI